MPDGPVYPSIIERNREFGAIIVRGTIIFSKSVIGGDAIAIAMHLGRHSILIDAVSSFFRKDDGSKQAISHAGSIVYAHML
jgi:hypothetical protein